MNTEKRDKIWQIFRQIVNRFYIYKSGVCSANISPRSQHIQPVQGVDFYFLKRCTCVTSYSLPKKLLLFTMIWSVSKKNIFSQDKYRGVSDERKKNLSQGIATANNKIVLKYQHDFAYWSTYQLLCCSWCKATLNPNIDSLYNSCRI